MAVLGTRHRKERVMVPILEAELGLRIQVYDEFDSDRFGTFTRDVPRTLSARDCVCAKATAACAERGGTIGVASEGSFGPHPGIPFFAVAEELVALVDTESGRRVFGTDVTADTNFGGATVRSAERGMAFAERAGFPSHGMVVIPVERDVMRVDLSHKGIHDPAELRDQLVETLQWCGSARIESDMRACANPTRMRSIERATRSLVENARRVCPRCGSHGFSKVGRVPGLECEACGAPTPRVKADQLECEVCGEREERMTGGLTRASSFECPACNP